MAMRLGETATVEEILTTFHSAFGNTESAESILKKFHGCVQQKGEPVVKYTSTIGGLFSMAVDLKAIQRQNRFLLKSVFYEGLEMDLKVAAMYKFDKVEDYNSFKAEVRKLEADMRSEGAKPCNSISGKEKEDKSDMGEMKAILKQISSRIDKIEKQQEEMKVTNMQQQKRKEIKGGQTGGEHNYQDGAEGPYQNYMYQQPFVGGARGPRHFRGHRGGRPGFRGTCGPGAYKPRRPTGARTFKPDHSKVNCYNCGEMGHMARDCPLNH